jgi:proteasome alpha subunit
VVAEVGKTQDDDEIYRITFDGSVADERNFVVMGGQADQVAAVLKDPYRDGMTLAEAFALAIAALAGPGKGEGEAGGGRSDVTAAQLEVALLDRGRAHRMFRRLTGTRLEALVKEAIPGNKEPGAIADAKAEPDESAESTD